MLELIDIEKHYGEGTAQIAALDGVSLSFRQSEFVSILGPSGCGKTTLLNIVGGLDRYSYGDLIINGVSTKKYRDKDWDSYRNHTIGFVFQTYNLIPHLSVLTNVELALTISGIGKEERRKRALTVLKEVGLGGQEKKRPNQLSGGQMQRVAIARALVNNPSVILADEPTGALDSVTSIQIMELLKNVAKDRLVIMVTHNPDIAERYSTRIIRILDGLIVDDSNPFDARAYNTATEHSEINANYIAEKHCESKANASGTENTDDSKDAKANDVVDEQTDKYNINADNAVNADDTISTDKSAEKHSEINANNAVDASDIVEEYIRYVTEHVGQKNKSSNNRAKKSKQERPPKTSMSFLTAIYSSFKNLIQKKGRALMTCFAGSIGIIGIALVLSVSAGFSMFINNLQQDGMGEYPISVMQYNMDMNKMMSMMQSGGPTETQNTGLDRFPDYQHINPYASPMLEQLKGLIIKNDFSDEYINYLNLMDKSRISGIKYERAYEMNLVSKSYTHYDTVFVPNYNTVDRVNSNLQELLDNYEYMNTQYDVLDVEGKLPELPNEVALVVDRYNRISVNVLEALGIPCAYDIDEEGYATISFAEILEIEFSLIWNDIFYTKNDKNVFVPSELDEESMFEQGKKLKIVGIIRQKRGTTMSWLRTGLVYSPTLTDLIIQHETNSEIVQAQIAEYNNYLDQLESNPQAKLLDVTTGKPMRSEWQGYLDMLSLMGFSAIANIIEFTPYDLQLAKLQKLGGTHIPTEIYIFPSNFANKQWVMDYLDEYNNGKEDNEKVAYMDSSGSMLSMMESIINVVSYVLVAFSAISLVVSSIMIGIITYVSVIERTKEIGVLRSLGARKRDVSRIFNAETMIIGITAGIIGVALTAILTLIISAILKSLTGIASLAILKPLTALALVGISTALTLVAGLIPARIAAEKDPVVALRTE